MYVEIWRACGACSGFSRLGAAMLLFAEAWPRHSPPNCAGVYAGD
jgi:hypothetical protein